MRLSKVKNKLNKTVNKIKMEREQYQDGDDPSKIMKRLSVVTADDKATWMVRR